MCYLIPSDHDFRDVRVTSEGAGAVEEPGTQSCSEAARSHATARAAELTPAWKKRKPLLLGGEDQSSFLGKVEKERDFSPSGRKKSKFKCLVPVHPHLNLDSSPSNFWCNQQSSYPKRGGKKGWHLPFPWLWNPTGSKLFEVLFREEAVIASILKRRKMPLYTDHGSSDLSGEGKQAGCKTKVRPACQQQK